MKHYYIWLLFLALPFCSISQVNFNNVATDLGLIVTAGNTYLGNGISFCDYNNDGWDDITMATQDNDKLRFYKNVNGTFVLDNLNIPFNNSEQKQVVWVDIDNDGDKDLFVTSNNDGNKLYLNLGNLNFEDITEAAGFPTENFESYGASWGDYDNDGFLDVFISNRSESNNQPNYFYRNNGDNTFTDVTEEAGFDNDSHMTFCSAFFDYDNDGWQDIYLSSDKYFNQNFLYRNNGDGTFTDVSVESNTAIVIDAMSTTIGDYNNDGWFDIYITNTPTDGNVLFRNNGDGTFTDIGMFSGVRLHSYAWGAVFLDADNDMDEDIYVSCEFDGSNPPYRSSAFFKNQGNNTFENSRNSGFIGDAAKSYSNAIGDFNNDGYPDIAVSNIHFENMYLWENQGDKTNNWLKVNLTGVQSNRDGIGSRIEISVNGNKQYRYTLCGEGYLAQNSNTQFFGVGTNTSIDYIKVTWLSGIIDYIENVTPNQVLQIREGQNSLNLESKNRSELSFYPNPVISTLTLMNKTPVSGVVIHNILGQEVFKKSLQNNQEEIQLSHLEPGIYFVKVQSNHISETIQIIKK
ncbi:FG-GAP-like repeat-containing protein [Bizionia myxarmorum]|uniref:T9SS type A sorting domain-containing protein n=1 Tax=Bizionia myxarmorum TaxID=291186 RepID=A0A5D0RF49_9FLAO|nr:FG-GAP-like repeat-containing protein [Bizionia myxarmorum]TYB79669.1 T9SS type A sorting domain-containing protein [Bizionia myxarmorum]